MIKKFLKKGILMITCLSLMLSLSSCGEDEIEEEMSQEQREYLAMLNIAASPYVDAIRQSRIVSPYAVINSFTKDFNEAARCFNDVMLAVEVTIQDIKNGKLFIGGDDDSSKGTVIDGYYTFFEEGFVDEAEEKCRTSLVISIANSDIGYLKYGSPIIEQIQMEDGSIVQNYIADTAITKYFLLGKINKVVGDRSSNEDKINIIMENARLVPATTYIPLFTLAQEASQQKVYENVAVLDTNSGENISQKVFTFHFGQSDLDEDGFCDDLTIQYDEFYTSSDFTKLINSNIYSKIKTPIDSYVQILFNANNATANAFNIPFPLKLSTLASGQCTGFNGTYVDYVKIDVLGSTTKDFLKNSISRESLLKNFEEYETSDFMFESKSLIFGISREKADDIKVALLDGTEENLSTPKRLWLKNPSIKMNGLISGDVYYKATYPFILIYKPELRFYDDTNVIELEANSYIFYDYETYIKTGDLIEKKNIKDSYDFVSNKNIYISTQKHLLENIEMKGSYTANSSEVGTGYYYTTNSYGEKILANCDVFYTGVQRFNIVSLSKDEENDDIYWLEVKSEQSKTGYIPIKMDGAWCKDGTNYAYYDNINNKNYYLFSTNEVEGIFTNVSN